MFISVAAGFAGIGMLLGWWSFEAAVVTLLAYVVIVLASIRDRLANTHGSLEDILTVLHGGRLLRFIKHRGDR